MERKLVLNVVLDEGETAPSPLRGCQPETNNVLLDVYDERARQVRHGYDADHDDEHAAWMLAHAGAMLALEGGVHDISVTPRWADRIYYKWQKQIRHRLVIAAAFIVAEIERIDRNEKK